MKTLAAALVALGLALPAGAQNIIPLKPDGALAAPCTVYGAPYNVEACNAQANPSVQQGTGESAALGLFASSTVVVSASFETVISSGGDITNTATPSISTTTTPGGSIGIPDGFELTLISTAAAGGGVYFQDNGTLSGSRLRLASATRLVARGKALTLKFSQAMSMWIEKAYASN